MEIAEEGGTQIAPLVSPHVKMRMLQQMAEALEDEAACLSRRAAAFEEEEFLLNRQIDERQLEINRLRLKLEAMGCERKGILERTESLRNEASAMREEAFNNEDEIALSIMEDIPPDDFRQQSGGPVFFQRITMAHENVAR